MAPRSNGFWAPIARLGAFFTAVVIGGNLLLGALYAPMPGNPESSGPTNYLDRKVKKLRKAFDRLRLQLFEEAPRPQSDRAEPLVFAFGYLPDPVPAQASGGREPELAMSAAVILDPILEPVAGSREPDPALYLHGLPPASLLWDPPPRIPEPQLRVGCGAGFWGEHRWKPASIFDQVSEHDFYATALRLPEDLDRWPGNRSHGILNDALDDLFGVPRVLGDELFGALRSWFQPSGTHSLAEEDERPMVSRLFHLRQPQWEESPFREFVTRWVERQQRHLSGHSEYLLTIGVQEGLSDVDESEFEYEQRKILWDVFRRTYFSRYMPKLEDKLKDEAWRFEEWRTVDMVVGPPILATYTWYRGFERRWTVLGTKLRLRVEPLYRIRQVYGDDEDDLVAAVALEWEIPGLALKVIASGGLHDGDPGMDFVGIGTSIGVAKSAVRHQMAADGEFDEE